MKSGLTDEPLSRAKCARIGGAARNGERIIAEQSRYALGVHDVERGRRRVEITREEAHRTIGHLRRLELSAELRGQTGLACLQPIGAIALDADALQAVGH